MASAKKSKIGKATKRAKQGNDMNPQNATAGKNVEVRKDKHDQQKVGGAARKAHQKSAVSTTCSLGHTLADILTLPRMEPHPPLFRQRSLQLRTDWSLKSLN